jgi:hypothetical protein
VPKGADDIRLIHDLSRPDGGVNALALDTSVTYATIDQATGMLGRNSFLAKVDLQNAYRSIPIHPYDYDLTGLSWKFSGDTEATHFVDVKLPFGASKSCQVFQRISDSISRMMAKRQMRVICYLDDMLCIGDDESDCQLVYDTLRAVLNSLGLIINEKKCQGPTQIITFLGVKIDSPNRTLSLPEIKLEELKVLVSKWMRKRRATKLEIQKFAGKLNWAARVVRGGRTFMRALLNLIVRLGENHHHIYINSAAREDISWWSKGLINFHGHCAFKCDLPLPNFAFAADACLVGGGAFYDTDWLYVAWEKDYPELLLAHINVLELFTVFLALRRWGPLWSGQHVLIRSDNVATVSSLNKSTSRGVELMPIIREIFWICVEHDVMISSVHIPGKLNILADKISRLHDLDEACFARHLLAGGLDTPVFCKGHMTESSFLWLQSIWTRGFGSCS